MSRRFSYPSSDESTIDYYDKNSYMFVSGTVNASMEETISQFAEMLPRGGRVLDWGCGSGRDSLVLSRLGFSVTSTDASEAMCKAARELLGDESDVRHETFSELQETGEYDGIWACASLLHAKPNELAEVLATAHDALADGGVLYCSFKQGEGCGYRHGRWFTDMSEKRLEEVLRSASFGVERIWVTSDIRKGHSHNMWVNALARKIG